MRLEVDGDEQEQTVAVREDLRLDVPPAEREVWTELLFGIGDLYVEVGEKLQALEQRLEGEEGAADGSEEAKEVRDQLDELVSRTVRLYRDISGWTGEPAADQRSRLDYYMQMADELGERAEQIAEAASQ